MRRSCLRLPRTIDPEALKAKAKSRGRSERYAGALVEYARAMDRYACADRRHRVPIARPRSLQ
jgi:hypothetical protein